MRGREASSLKGWLEIKLFAIQNHISERLGQLPNQTTNSSCNQNLRKINKQMPKTSIQSPHHQYNPINNSDYVQKHQNSQIPGIGFDLVMPKLSQFLYQLSFQAKGCWFSWLLKAEAFVKHDIMVLSWMSNIPRIVKCSTTWNAPILEQHVLSIFLDQRHSHWDSQPTNDLSLSASDR